MKLGLVISARMKSKRLKKKAILKLNGKTVLQNIISRAKKVKACKEIIFCTSKKTEDKILVKIAQKEKIKTFTGHDKDVFSRLKDAANQYKLDYYICITGDNPLFSVYYANRIVEVIKKKHFDFIYTKGLPLGIGISAVSTKAAKLICSYKKMLDTEIWGPLINIPKFFKVKSFKIEKRHTLPISRITLDEKNDYNLIKKIFLCKKNNKIIDINDLIKIFKHNPSLKNINKKVKQRYLSKKKIKNILKITRQNKKLIYSL